MSSVVVIGSQWGDEGKGKIVDYLAQQADAVVRYSGGSNAGHTVVVNDVSYKLRLLPSGILYRDKTCILGNGVVINPRVVLQEIAEMKAKGVDTSNLLISDRAHVVFPYHEKQDELQEAALGDAKIGTTKGGIGPCYMDKYARTGIRVCDLMNKDILAEKLKRNLAAKNALFTKVYGAEPLEYEPMLKAYLGYAEELRPHVTDTSVALGNIFDANKKVLFEGAQASMLDCDNGTYPFVTSSHPTAGGACIGAGIGPHMMQNIYGVVKAYSTRVGQGPFPTELLNETGEHIRSTAHEYGTVTGRPRRVGWLDTRAVRYAAALNSFDYLAVTRLDVLDDMDEIQVCTGYEYEGKPLEEYPADLNLLEKVTPVYRTFPGWKTAISDIRSYSELPEKARNYLEAVSELIGVPVGIVSVGPSREQTIVVKDVF